MISVTKLWTAMAKEFGVNESAETFQFLALSAINRTIRDLNIYLDESIAEVTSMGTSSSIDLSTTLQNALEFGVRFYMSITGEFPKTPKGDLEAMYFKQIGLAQASTIPQTASEDEEESEE